MKPEIAQTVSLTTRCSAGCSHCPYSNPALPPLDLPRDRVRALLGSTQLTVFSGGEPFEYPQIEGLLQELPNEARPFRIATGGFIDLSPWANLLVALESSGFLEISLGTDALSSRVSNPDFALRWRSNVQLFHRLNIPYSLTLTTGANFHPSLEILSKCHPQFIYLRYSRNQSPKSWVRRLTKHFRGVPVILDAV